MTTHSPAYRSISTASEQRASRDLYKSDLSRPPFRPRPGAEMSTWRGAWRTVSANDLPRDERAVSRELDARLNALHADDIARASVIVDAVRNGEASDIVVIDRNTLGPDGLEMLEKLNQLGRTIPAGTQPTLEKNTPTASVGNGNSEHGNLKLDFKTCRAYWREKPVNLTITEFNIVCLFARRIGENLTYREIYDVVHGEGFYAGEGTRGYQTNVRSLIKRIRQKFNAADASFAAIENHRGFGYRWQAPKDGAASQPSPTVADGTSPESAGRSLVLMVLLANQPAG